MTPDDLPKTKRERAEALARTGLLLKSLFESAVDVVARNAGVMVAIGVASIAGVGSFVAYAETQSLAAQIENQRETLEQVPDEISARLAAETTAISEAIQGIDIMGIDEDVADVEEVATTALGEARGAQATADDAMGSALEANREAARANSATRTNAAGISTNRTAIDSALEVALAAQDSADTSQAAADQAQESAGNANTSAGVANSAAEEAGAAAAMARELVDAIPADLAALQSDIAVIEEDVASVASEILSTRTDLSSDITSVVVNGSSHVDLGPLRIVWTTITIPDGRSPVGGNWVLPMTLPASFADASWLPFYSAHRTGAPASIITPTGPDTFTIEIQSISNAVDGGGASEVSIMGIGAAP